jgi:glycerophosphoryl diester phosphodiesterase
MTGSLTIIGHRGARGHAPENTLLALDTGIRLGAAWLECDVQHVDGELWLMHDLTIDRTTSGHGLLGDKNAAQIRALDAGGGQRVPTLREALDLVGNRAGVNIELKTWNGCAQAVAEQLRDYIADGWPADRFLVSSFHHPELWEFHQRLPNVPTGALICGVPLDWAACAAELGADVLSLSSEFVDDKLVDDAHRRGVRVFVYTVNEVDEMRRLKTMGVDGIFTDYPDRGVAVAAHPGGT